MINKKEVTQENFDMLLKWLHPDPETAGQKYENIRQRLIRLFVGRGCFEAEELADETINRVIHKLPQLIDNYIGEPTLYFYGVADKIHFEWLRKEKKKRDLQFPDTNYDNEPEPEMEYECLETCLEVLPTGHRELIIGYYTEEKRTKIEYRKQLAQNLGITISALHLKTCRIRAKLLQCMQNCISTRNI
jgi:DNA-directed RNA polymerase specialized sigma24 family protein